MRGGSNCSAPGWRSVPEKKVDDTFRASLAYCYLARDYIDGDYRQTPGKLNYHAFYPARQLGVRAGLRFDRPSRDARKMLGYFLKWQQPDGNFVSDMWDGWGQTLWIFGEHAELSRDREFAARVYPSFRRPSVGWRTAWKKIRTAFSRRAGGGRRVPQGPMGACDGMELPRTGRIARGHQTGPPARQAARTRRVISGSMIAGRPRSRSAERDHAAHRRPHPARPG